MCRVEVPPDDLGRAVARVVEIAVSAGRWASRWDTGTPPPQWSRPLVGAEGRSARRSRRSRSSRNGAAPWSGRREGPGMARSWASVKKPQRSRPLVGAEGRIETQDSGSLTIGRNGAAPWSGRRALLGRMAAGVAFGTVPSAPWSGRRAVLANTKCPPDILAAMEPPLGRGGGSARWREPASRAHAATEPPPWSGRRATSHHPGRAAGLMPQWSRPLVGAEGRAPRSRDDAVLVAAMEPPLGRGGVLVDLGPVVDVAGAAMEPPLGRGGGGGCYSTPLASPGRNGAAPWSGRSAVSGVGLPAATPPPQWSRPLVGAECRRRRSDPGL